MMVDNESESLKPEDVQGHSPSVHGESRGDSNEAVKHESQEAPRDTFAEPAEESKRAA